MVQNIQLQLLDFLTISVLWWFFWRNARKLHHELDSSLQFTKTCGYHPQQIIALIVPLLPICHLDYSLLVGYIAWGAQSCFPCHSWVSTIDYVSLICHASTDITGGYSISAGYSIIRRWRMTVAPKRTIPIGASFIASPNALGYPVRPTITIAPSRAWSGTG